MTHTFSNCVQREVLLQLVLIHCVIFFFYHVHVVPHVPVIDFAIKFKTQFFTLQDTVKKYIILISKIKCFCSLFHLQLENFNTYFWVSYDGPVIHSIHTPTLYGAVTSVLLGIL